jgi:hypothetical protein
LQAAAPAGQGPPLALAAAAAAGGGGVGGGAGGVGVGVGAGGVGVGGAPLTPPGSDWTGHKAPDGRTYFYNTVTKQSSWSKPKELMTPLEMADAQTPWKVRAWLGDAESSLGDAERACWVTLRARWVTWRARWVTLRELTGRREELAG